VTEGIEVLIAVEYEVTVAVVATSSGITILPRYSPSLQAAILLWIVCALGCH
jgi:hypothetical protein